MATALVISMAKVANNNGDPTILIANILTPQLQPTITTVQLQPCQMVAALHSAAHNPHPTLGSQLHTEH